MTTPGPNAPDEQPGGSSSGAAQPPAGSPGGYSPPPPPPPGGFPQGPYQPHPQGGPFPPQGGGQYWPQGGGPYPPQGGAPYPPQGGAPYPAGAGAYGAPQRKGPPKWLIPVVAGVVLVAAALALFLVFGNSNSNPEVNDCFDSSALQANGEGEVKVVDCDSNDAAAQIIGIDHRKLTAAEYQADPTTCSDFTGWDRQLWVGPVDDPNATGTIYCLRTL